MKNVFVALTAVAVLLVASAAQAATANPTRQSVVGNLYLGVNAGTKMDRTDANAGVVLGSYVNKRVAVEADYDFAHPDAAVAGVRDYSYTVTANVLPTMRLTDTFAVYGLVGAGYSWHDVETDRVVYAVGAGAKFALTQRLELDARYRYIDTKNSKVAGNEDRLSLGLNVKF